MKFKSKNVLLLVTVILLVLAIIFFCVENFEQRTLSTLNQPVQETGCSSSTENSEVGNEHSQPSNIFFFTHDNISGIDDIYSSDEVLRNLKKLNTIFNSNFIFYEMSFQPLYFIGSYTADSRFCVASNDGTSPINQKGIDANGNEITVTPIRTVRVGKNWIDILEDCVLYGHNFTETDFLVKKPDQVINVLLGYNYTDYYQIGDTFKLSLLEKEINFRVIGFLRQGITLEKTEIMIDSEAEIVELDWSIVLPFYSISYDAVDSIDRSYQIRYYIQKNSGFIKMDSVNIEDPESIKNLKELEQQLAQAQLKNPYLSEYYYYLTTVESLSEKEKATYYVSLSPIIN